LFDGMIREKFQDLFGLGISGAISGVLYDQDNERGIWVRSDAHPTPWMAFGDGNLGCSPTSREQAELAVITAREELVAAQALGRTTSAGEKQLVAAEPSGYASDRRVELSFRAAGTDPPDLVWAQQAIAERFGTPPYQTVERYVPQEAPGLNDAQEDWHWG